MVAVECGHCSHHSASRGDIFLLHCEEKDGYNFPTFPQSSVCGGVQDEEGGHCLPTNAVQGGHLVHPSLECPKSLDCLWFFINSLHMKTTKGLQWNPFVEECEGCSWNVYPVPICHRLWFLSLTGNPCRYMTNKNTLVVPLHCCIWQERKLLPWIIIHYYWSSRWATLNKLLGYPITLDNIDGKPYLQSIYGPTLNIALFLECMQLFLASLEILRMFCLRRNI